MFSAIHINHKVPGFKASSFFQSTIQDLQLSTYLGQWVVLFFYTSDFENDSKNEVMGFQDNYGEYQKLGVQILGCSTDSSTIHEAWVKILSNVSFPLLSDSHHTMSIDYNVFDENKAQCLNGTFIIDAEQNLVWYQISGDQTPRSQTEIIQTIKNLQRIKS